MLQLTLSPPQYSVLMALLEDGIEINQSHPLLEVFAKLREDIVVQAGGVFPASEGTSILVHHPPFSDV